MKILRWLLCHLLLITVLVSLSLGFVFRDSLKEDFNRLTGKSNQSVKAVAVATEKVNKKQSSVEKNSSKLSMNDVERNNLSVELDQEKAQLQQKSSFLTDPGKLPGVDADRAGSNTPSQDEKNAHNLWDQVVPSNSERSHPVESAKSSGYSDKSSQFPPDDYVPEEDGSKPDSAASKSNREEMALLSTSDSVSGTNPSLMQGQPDVPAGKNFSNNTSAYLAALAEVRQLYWDGKTGAAQEAYEKLMFDYPAQPEAAAELGNIFLQQSNREAASWAYQNAIPRYLNLHREQEAINLMRFISQYDPAIAESLQKKYW